MKNLLRIEEAFMFGLAIYLNSFLPFAGWVFWALFLLPDVGMLGYLINTRVGAITSDQYPRGSNNLQSVSS